MKKAVKQSTMTLILNVLSIVLLAGVIICFLFYANINSRIDDANTDRFDLTLNANRFMNGSAYLTNEVRGYAATGDQEHYDNYYNEINNLKNRDIGVANMKDIGITGEEQAMIDAMGALSNELVPLEEEAMSNVAADRMDAALEYVYGAEYSTAIAKINQMKTTFLDTLDQRTGSVVDRLMETSNAARITVLCMAVTVVILQVVNYVLTRRRIILPIIQVKNEMEEISKGNLSAVFAMESDTSEIGLLVDSIHHTKRELKKYIGDISNQLSRMAGGNMDIRVDIDYIGDFGPIKDALETIVGSLNNTLARIEVASNEVSTSAGQVSQGAQALSQGATEQASAVEELSATVAELSSQIGRTAENAASAKEVSSAAGGTLILGNGKMREMMEAMEEISQASSQIGRIIKTVEDIAFQTNILALNAAVEAARAGAAGKGFAVVADEVRNLANKSQEAAKNTTGLIDNSLKAVEKGVILASDTAETLDQVVEGAKQSTAFVEQIAADSSAQAVALRQVTLGLEQISGVVQTNAATAEQSAAASEELSGQSETLKELVGAFHLKASARSGVSG